MKAKKIFTYIFMALASMFFSLFYIFFLDEPKNIQAYNQTDPGSKILVVAPHPDDESIAAAGVIARAVSEKEEIRVVMVTNGDGFKKAVKKFAQKGEPESGDYLNLGRARQEETLRALASLGLAREKVLFLGYPDGAMNLLWEQYWDTGKLYTTDNTKVNRVPYEIAFQKGAPYCGESVVDSLREIISQFRPNVIYYPNSEDEHPDHRATSAFVKYTLTSMNYGSVKEYTYIVHRKFWPVTVPSEHRPLGPPEELAGTDIKWVYFPLNEEEITLKARALKEHQTQQAVMETYLNSFVRKNELFGVVPTAPIPVEEKVPLGICNNHPGSTTREAGSDNFTRRMEGQGDIVAVGGAVYDKKLYLFIETRWPADAEVQYKIDARFFYDNGPAGRLNILLSENAAIIQAPAGSVKKLPVKYNENRALIEVPVESWVDTRYVFMATESSYKNKTIDQTAWRLFELPAIKWQ